MDDGVSQKNVEQPPPAVPFQRPATLAKPARAEYRRTLPHFQAQGKPLFVTLCTFQRWELPTSVRALVMQHCLHDHGMKMQAHGVVVMPDHVHMIISPLSDAAGNVFGLAEIMRGIKGASAHSINQALMRRGPMWQREYFDHVLRSDEKIREKVEYICQNPVRKGLVQIEDDYPWLWREWLEGENVAPPPPAARE